MSLPQGFPFLNLVWTKCAHILPTGLIAREHGEAPDGGDDAGPLRFLWGNQ